MKKINYLKKRIEKTLYYINLKLIALEKVYDNRSGDWQISEKGKKYLRKINLYRELVDSHEVMIFDIKQFEREIY